ncbi:hypothetical protein B0T21DRAFT_394943 [Apiosordaria backusii]|uniref:Uncharacterized protein n=1 Tax=Apiosordaria backusii TaxID=314023 RepID=A0AA40E464_9PEZI|nr:hypothetical protein B0T21DRAFT_394943 [Apiosordaria backusii]
MGNGRGRKKRTRVWAIARKRHRPSPLKWNAWFPLDLISQQQGWSFDHLVSRLNFLPAIAEFDVLVPGRLQQNLSLIRDGAEAEERRCCCFGMLVPGWDIRAYRIPIPIPAARTVLQCRVGRIVTCKFGWVACFPHDPAPDRFWFSDSLRRFETRYSHIFLEKNNFEMRFLPWRSSKLEFSKFSKASMTTGLRRGAVPSTKDPQQGVFARIGLVSGTEWPGRPRQRHKRE